MKIQDSVALVSGANRGLGLAFAKALLARGAKKVYAAARDPSSVTLPGVVPVTLDVTQPDSVATLAAALTDVTLLINNAGISKGQGALAADAVTNARQEIETNYLGPLAMSQAFAPILGKNGGGAIINVLSALSWVTLPRSTTYSASKAAAWALTNGLRGELREQKTQVVGLHVGFVDTDLTRNVDAPKEQPDDVIARTLDALEAEQDEALADEVSKHVKAGLSQGVYLRPVSAG
jgi:NAD(P)-dependent dehydrogenase (short-subunit alcohol dehydrogenase family)